MTSPTAASTTTPRRRYLGTALAIAVAGAVIALVWGAFAGWSLWRDIDDFPRADIPGELSIDVTEPGEQFVYYERREWFATVPVDVDLDVEVTGPDGLAVPTDPHGGTVNYRQVRLVGQSHATFEAAEAGTYVVVVTGVDVHDDAAFAVGPGITGSVMRALAGPVLVFLGAIVLAVVVVVMATQAPGGATARRRGGERSRA